MAGVGCEVLAQLADDGPSRMAHGCSSSCDLGPTRTRQAAMQIVGSVLATTVGGVMCGSVDVN